MTVFQVPKIVAEVRLKEIEKYKRNNSKDRAEEVTRHIRRAKEIALANNCS